MYSQVFMQLMDSLLRWVVFFKGTIFTYIEDNSLFIENWLIFLFHFPDIMELIRAICLQSQMQPNVGQFPMRLNGPLERPT